MIWIDIPGLTKAHIDSNDCKNIKFVSKRGLSSYNVKNNVQPASPYEAMLFSCEGENIINALEVNNPDVITALFTNNKELYSMLKKVRFDKAELKSNDGKTTEEAYFHIKEARPNFTFVNLSGLLTTTIDSESEEASVDKKIQDIDKMVGTLFQALIEARLFNNSAFIITAYDQEKENGLLLIQADGFIAKNTEIEESVNLSQVMPTINYLIGGLQNLDCPDKSILPPK